LVDWLKSLHGWSAVLVLIAFFGLGMFAGLIRGKARLDQFAVWPILSVIFGIGGFLALAVIEMILNSLIGNHWQDRFGRLNLPLMTVLGYIAAVCEGRKVLVLTEGSDLLNAVCAVYGDRVSLRLVMHGRTSRKERAAVISALGALVPDAPRVLLATGKLVGEGFDHPPLDTLVLAMPVS
jgi:hypothetical protein